ncbi:39S ribosomal protein L28-like protein [Dinothrombium tinctorium]|uniref:Large ribosomal subunit protein bL28m n=1 Tax=Dinothrombium tinctorium TaxID=1965070 RepID=A0A3S3P9P4_9ACAR|nr:39S ribosomal protein L28-like protein [Dinothrombium tinctorium]
MSRKAIDVSLYTRLPLHYRRMREELNKPSTRVHDEPVKTPFVDFYMRDEKKQIIDRMSDVPIKVDYPSESDSGLWGGEGVIRGHPLTWFPSLQRAVVYSEIFDKHLSVVVTRRTLQLIDDAHGFDNYILRTPIQDLKSQLALDLRRKMLITLAKKDFAKDDPKRFEFIWKKYGDCAIPLEEAEWFGLPISKAMAKLISMEKEQNPPQPLKVKFAKELIEKLEGIYKY